ncbi:UNVERIFIED_CONTAM: Transposon Tf2-11 polyprotein [Sesamum angustifolium]|uniref:Transposon Tf2-11 polyprotein n=1 Tax=Sesamum angustifolium TaxID=2727405 RepID=A0AAW2IY90_9LAMI
MPRHALGGTSGRRAHLALVQRTYYCPHLFDLSAGQGRPSEKTGLLQPLPIPKRPWESVSMDYISGLPKVGDLGSIIVVVDRLSNMPLYRSPKTRYGGRDGSSLLQACCQILGPAEGHR